MTPSAVPARALLRALVAAAALLRSRRRRGAATPERGDFDARARGEQHARGAALRERLGRFGLVTAEPRTGTPRAVAKLDGFLTGPSGRPRRRRRARVRARPRRACSASTATTSTACASSRRDARRRRRAPDVGAALPRDPVGRHATAGGRDRVRPPDRRSPAPPAPDLAVGSIEPSVSAERAYAAVRGAGIGVRAARRRRRAGDRVRGRRPRVARALPGRRRRAARLARARAGVVERGLRRDRRRAQRRRRAALQPRRLRERATCSARTRATSPQATRAVRRLAAAPGATKLSGRSRTRSSTRPTTCGSAAYAARGGRGRRLERRAVAVLAGERLLGGGPVHLGLRRPGLVAATTANQSATQLFYLVNTFHDHLAQQPIGFDGFEDADPVLAQAMDGAAVARRGPPQQRELPHAARTASRRTSRCTSSRTQLALRRLRRRQRRVARLPRVHARAVEPARDRRAGVRRAQHRAGRARSARGRATSTRSTTSSRRG